MCGDAPGQRACKPPYGARADPLTSGWPPDPGNLDELDDDAEQCERVEIRKAPVALEAVAPARLADDETQRLERLERLDVRGEVVRDESDVAKTCSVPVEPFGVDARTADRLDQLDLRLDVGQGDPERELASPPRYPSSGTVSGV
jgi:hypothetical protein